MLTFLYDLPNWGMGVVISVFFVAVTLLSYFLFRRFVKSAFDDGETSLAMTMLGVIATVNALLLAFSAVSVWEAFGTADSFVLRPTHFNLTLIAALSFSIGLVFYFIIAMDRPFAGEESISPAPFESAIANMQRWDREVAASR